MRIARIVAIVTALALLGGVAFAQGTTETELTAANAQRAETSFGDLTADALASAANTKIAFVPAVALKSGTIAAGPVTKAKVSELLTQPGETWAVVSLSGAELREALERSVSRTPQPQAGFLQVAGISMTYDPDLPRNQRIVNLKVGDVDVSPDTSYEVAMPISLAKGGSGYFMIFGEDDIARQGADEMADAIVSFVEQKGSVSYTELNRIKPTAGG